MLVEIPWQEWLRSDVAQGLDVTAAAVAAVAMVLRSLHRKGKVDEQGVTVLLDLDSKQTYSESGQGTGTLGPGTATLRSTFWADPRDELAPTPCRNSGDMQGGPQRAVVREGTDAWSAV